MRAIPEDPGKGENGGNRRLPVARLEPGEKRLREPAPIGKVLECPAPLKPQFLEPRAEGAEHRLDLFVQ